MNIDLNQYNDLYIEYKDKIDLACTRINSNPCQDLATELGQLYQSLNNQIDSLNDWVDSAKDVFIENIEYCVDDLDTIITSINDNWKKAETLYQEIQEYLDSFKEQIDVLQDLLDSEPQKENYKIVSYDENNQPKVSYTGYNRDLNLWQTQCDADNKKCNQYKELILDKIKTLQAINNIQNDIQGISNMNLIFGINPAEWAKFTEDFDLDWYANAGYISYVRNADGKLTIRFKQMKGTPWGKNVCGLNLVDGGCGINSLATALTSTLSYQTGQDVIVTPEDVAISLNAHAENNGKSGLTAYFPGQMGDYEPIAEAVSNTYGVMVLYTDNSLTTVQAKNATDSSATIVYSVKGGGHVASLTGTADNNGFMIADTLNGKSGYINGATFDGGSRSMIVAGGDYGVSGNYLTINGSTQIPDIGSMSYVAIDGETYQLTRTQVENSDLYQYEINAIA